MSEESPTPSIKPPPKTSALGDAVRAYLWNLRRWSARTFTGENLVSSMKTFAWVAPLTILIWVYAEREQVVQRETTIPIAVKSTDPNRIVSLRPGDESIVAFIGGPRLAVDRVIELVTNPGKGPIVQIEIDGRGYESGKWVPVDTERYVGENPIFRNRGVAITSCKPRTLQILVDELVERDVEVRVPTDVTNLAGSPVFEPSTVRVRGPKTKLEDPRQPLVITADLANREEIQLPGPHQLPAVSVRANISDPSITLSPSTVKATLDVSQKEERYLIASMPIWQSTPTGFLEKYRIECPPSISNITVIGPHDQIELLRKGEVRPKAQLEVTAEDEGKQRTARELKFDLPDRVKVVAEDKEKTKVLFQLVKPE
ncbi:MAG: hypothetical protein H7Z14_00470 [Anaerolineae bacterium]|nr:hypothetical protein [Phycisphaerae bacterium]